MGKMKSMQLYVYIAPQSPYTPLKRPPYSIAIGWSFSCIACSTVVHQGYIFSYVYTI